MDRSQSGNRMGMGCSVQLVSLILLLTISLMIITTQAHPQGGPLINESNTKRRHISPSLLSNLNRNSDKEYRFTSPQQDGLRLNKWISSSLKFLEFHRCSQAVLASDDECFKLSRMTRSEMGVYLGWSKVAPHSSQITQLNNSSASVSFSPMSPTTRGKVYPILPDSSSPKANGPHDLVLVLDPYPTANFGHLVLMFYIDFGRELKTCKDTLSQIYSTNDETCITLGKKPRCPNLVERFSSGGLQPRRCHVEFLPTVYTEERVNSPSSGHGKDLLDPDLLECISLPEFAPCPKLRPLQETSKVLCDSAASNSKRCDTSRSGVGTKCKLFQTCDQAILIGGGWNRLHSGLQSHLNIQIMENSLKSSGFSSENIKTFYANGKLSRNPSSNTPVSGYEKVAFRKSRSSEDFYSTAMKTGLRGHLRTLCDTRHCADTLMIYLNNPTTVEGDMLLWDVDFDGVAGELESYGVKELLADLAGCEAKRVLIVADQSNTDILMASLKSSPEHHNVILFTSGLPNQISTNGELTLIWANNSHPITCLKHVQEASSSQMTSSNPAIYDATDAVASKLSIIGAPCDLNPPVNSRELKALYQGCQNVPTSIWFSFNFEELGDLGGEGEEVELTGVDVQSGDIDSDDNFPTSRRSNAQNGSR